MLSNPGALLGGASHLTRPVFFSVALAEKILLGTPSQPMFALLAATGSGGEECPGGPGGGGGGGVGEPALCVAEGVDCFGPWESGPGCSGSWPREPECAALIPPGSCTALNCDPGPEGTEAYFARWADQGSHYGPMTAPLDPECLAGRCEGDSWKRGPGKSLAADAP